MFDEICSAMRDAIHDILEDAFMSEGSELDCLISNIGCESICIQYIDDGLAIRIGNSLYGISIQKV